MRVPASFHDWTGVNMHCVKCVLLLTEFMVFNLNVSKNILSVTSTEKQLLQTFMSPPVGGKMLRQNWVEWSCLHLSIIQFMLCNPTECCLKVYVELILRLKYQTTIFLSQLLYGNLNIEVLAQMPSHLQTFIQWKWTQAFLLFSGLSPDECLPAQTFGECY